MKKIRHTLVLLLLLPALLLGPGARAQMAVKADTSVFHARELIAPGVLAAAGIGIHCFAHEAIDVPVNTWFQESWRAGGPELGFDNYIQYLPVAMDLGLGLVGVRADRGFVDRLVEGSLACLTMFAISRTCKYIINYPRPNGGVRSFPSGHSSMAFVGAELVRMEYGWGWGAGAYAIATTVAVMRNYNNWHWLSDCLLGAGIGILSAHVGRWLLEPTKRLLHIRTSEWGAGRPAVQVSFAPSVDPYSGSICAGLAMVF